MHGEIREELKKMVQYWEDAAATWSEKMRLLKLKPTKKVKHFMDVTTDHPVVTSSLKCSATSPPEQRRARTAPDRRHHYTLLARKSLRCNRSNFSKKRPGFSYMQLLTRHVSFGTCGKHPFDRGRNGDVEACLVIRSWCGEET
ncbi:hypothetical protein Bca4012_010513 [Brassica carinata]|uniref:Uncharacterized protein n=1 Tax=Brassica carinata TaxID=52824 RepID=A0A8X7S341_BRACI|nr:hypothetical protein Bca52824_035429 [Brassica carinata]